MEPSIDIEGKTLAYSLKDVKRLTQPEGCDLNLVTDRVYGLDDLEASDEEDFDEPYCNSTPESKLERMKREFISLTSNSNRDPIKPGNETKLRKLLFNNDENAENSEIPTTGKDFEPLRDDHRSIHKRYHKLGSDFETIISNKEKWSFEEISANRVYKRTLTPGYGAKIDEHSMVVYNCASWTEKSSEPYDSTWLRRNTFITDLANDSILPGIHELLLTTRKGEWCEAFIRPQAAFGPLGVKPRIPANATIFCLLEVVNVIPKDKISILSYNPKGAQKSGTTFKDFFEASNEARMRGNYFFDQKQYRIALHRYKSGIRILEALTYNNEKEENQAKELLLKLYNNSARAANALGCPRLALAACKQASLIDEIHPKTYWHRMVAWKLKGHTDMALSVARRAIQLFQGDSKAKQFFKREEELLKKKIQMDRVELTKLHRLMGSAMS